MAATFPQIGLTPDVSAALQGTSGSPSDTNRYVTDQDSRLTGGGGAPSGPAGGVLGGTYPNPSFAVDMATQAELDAAIAGVAAGALSFASMEKFANG